MIAARAPSLRLSARREPAKKLDRRIDRPGNGRSSSDVSRRRARRGRNPRTPPYVYRALQAARARPPRRRHDEIQSSCSTRSTRSGRLARGSVGGVARVLDPAQNHAFKIHYLDVGLESVTRPVLGQLTWPIRFPAAARPDGVIRFDGYHDRREVAIGRGLSLAASGGAEWPEPGRRHTDDDCCAW